VYYHREKRKESQLIPTCHVLKKKMVDDSTEKVDDGIEKVDNGMDGP
jgi:hypothetical protein